MSAAKPDRWSPSRVTSPEKGRPVDAGQITINGDRINGVELTVTAGDFRVEAVGEVAMVRSLSAYLRGASCRAVPTSIA